ncbi:MAG: hypothetical protein VW419_01160, partial [Paracoccaceae bacterium]
VYRRSASFICPTFCAATAFRSALSIVSSILTHVCPYLYSYQNILKLIIKYSGIYELRFALRGTKLWGAYLTDIIKDFDQKISGKVVSFLKENPDFEKQNVEYFLNEISDLEVKEPTLVALGTPTFDILNRNLSDRYKIIKIRHYVFRENKEKYRDHVEEVCTKYL